MEGFYRQKEGETRKLKEDYFRQLPCLGEGGTGRWFSQADYLTGLIRKFQIDWFKILLLVQAKTLIRLDIKSWWGLAKVTLFWTLFF